VKADQVDRLRLDLAIDGILPDKGTGFELFDNASVTMTDSDRKILYQRALEGELERSIESLEEVERARVHIALAEDSIFIKDKKPATASIILTLKQGRSLAPKQILGIISLVSGAVKDLPEENVRVVDSKANLLSEGIIGLGDDFWGEQNTGRLMELENQFELGLKEDLRKMLEQVFGAGKVVVNVNADLDFDSEESTIITYDPQGVVRSEQTRIIYNGGLPTGSGGSPIDENSNVIDENGNPVTGGSSSHETTKNYEIGEKTTYTKKAPGEVKRICTSVVYDGKLDDNMKQAITNIVMAATGFDDKRGDLINVEGVSFDTSLKDEIAKLIAKEEEERKALQAAEAARLRRTLIYGGSGISGAVLLSIILLFIMQSRKGSMRANEVTSMFAATIDEPLPVEDIMKKVSEDKAAEDPEIKIKNFAKNNPDKMTDLIRAWILEDER